LIEQLNTLKREAIEQNERKEHEIEENLMIQRHQLERLLTEVDSQLLKTATATSVEDKFRVGVFFERSTKRVKDSKGLCEIESVTGKCKAVLEMPDITEFRVRYPRDYNGRNLLNHHLTGGTATVVEILGLNGSTVMNEGTLEGETTASWNNNGLLIDLAPTNDNPELSYRPQLQTGTAWGQPGGGNGTGVIVIDLTGENNRAYRISKFTFFQMTSDGAVTAIKLSYHTSLVQVPSHSTDGWIELTNWIDIGAAVVVPNPDGLTEGNTVEATETWTGNRFPARFIKIEARNDGRNGSPNYIEIRQIKAFY